MIVYDLYDLVKFTSDQLLIYINHIWISNALVPMFDTCVNLMISIEACLSQKITWDYV